MWTRATRGACGTRACPLTLPVPPDSACTLTCKAPPSALSWGDGPEVPGVHGGRVEGQRCGWREGKWVALPGEVQPFQDALPHLLHLGSLLGLQVKCQHVKTWFTRLCSSGNGQDKVRHSDGQQVSPHFLPSHSPGLRSRAWYRRPARWKMHTTNRSPSLPWPQPQTNINLKT